MTDRPASLLVLGGARSGKSRYAQTRAEAFDLELVFIATAQAFDDEMRDRIVRHRVDRGPRWRTVEEPIDLVEAIVANSNPRALVLVDCLTLWTSNMMLGHHDLTKCCQKLSNVIATATGPLIFVSNETGLGIVPDNALARQFRDHAGWINQVVAAAVSEVVMTIAGIPLLVRSS
jgi:adenosylcobinamide kinase/adenosylcobinamide-phosphate guanylyltransferase